MRFCRAQIVFLLVVVVLGTSSMLSSCGQKGPLYLPETPSKTTSQKADS